MFFRALVPKGQLSSACAAKIAEDLIMMLARAAGS